MTEYIVGSSYFFEESKRRDKTDVDKVIIDTRAKKVFEHTKNTDGDTFVYNFKDKSELLDWHYNVNRDAMNILMLIVPEILSHFDLELSELSKLFARYLNRTKRDWGVLVFEYYLQNGSPTLTEKQLNDVHDFYINRRKVVDIGMYQKFIELDKVLATMTKEELS